MKSPRTDIGLTDFKNPSLEWDFHILAIEDNPTKGQSLKKNSHL